MFRNVYSKEIQDPEQPLLVHRPKDKEVQRVMQVYIYIYIFIYFFQPELAGVLMKVTHFLGQKKACTGVFSSGFCFVRYP